VRGFPLVNLSGVFSNIAPGKFGRSSCSWLNSLVKCMIFCSATSVVFGLVKLRYSVGFTWSLSSNYSIGFGVIRVLIFVASSM